ncbi:MAG: peptide chain release factor N(5)-glutamine methyltransferase [Lachnospiraceae bacterium]|nr:peptide chain release factor N(5)-glutamine methyltransferase [Lachnospiraceae bacterium]
MNYSELYRHGTQVLSAAGISEAALEARLLLEFITGHDTNTLYAHPDTDVSEREADAYERILAKRADRIPLQHLTGTCSFMGIDFRVSGKVLVPRQDSECLVEEAMRYVGDGSRILDLCTGSGCLLLSLMHYKNACTGIGVDISEDALSVANDNLADIDKEGGLNGGSASFLAGDLYDALPGEEKRFDYIISNPPYIKSADIETLAPEVRDHDPRIALDGGDDGLVFYRRIAAGAQEHLTRGGMIFLEIGYDQADEVSKILKDEGFTDITVIKDYAGKDRVICSTNLKTSS